MDHILEVTYGQSPQKHTRDRPRVSHQTALWYEVHINMTNMTVVTMLNLNALTVLLMSIVVTYIM